MADCVLSDNAVFISETNRIPGNVASAALEAGLPSGSVDEFVGYIVAHNETGLAAISDATPEIISAGADAALDTYAAAFRLVWLTAIPFLGIAAICTTPSPEVPCVTTFADIACLAAVFLFDPTEEFNNHIDAPVEDRNELYSK